MKAKIIAGAGWSAVEALSGQLISFAVFLVLARLLSPADFGLIALANIYVLIVQYLIFQGLGQAIIQFQDLDDGDLDTVFWINLGIAIVFTGVTFLTAPALAFWFGAPPLADILRALSPIFLLAALTDVQSNLLGKKLQFKALAFRTLFSYLLGGVAGVFLAWRGAGVWSFVAQQLTVWLVNFITLWAASPWRPGLGFSVLKAKRLLGFGANLVGVDLMGLANKRADQFVVGRALGPQTLGFYAVGSRVSSLVSEVIVKSLARVTLSGLSRLQNEKERFLLALGRIFELQMAVALPISVGMALLAGPIVAGCFGEKWMPGVPVMQVLLLAIPLEALSAVHFSALIALGQPRWCSILMTCHAALNLLFCFLAAKHGVVAVAVAVALRAVVLYPLEVWIVRRVIPLSLFSLLKTLGPLLVATLLMAGAVFGMGRLFPFSEVPRLVGQIFAGTVVYLGVLALIQPRLFRDLAGFREMIGKGGAR